MSSNPRTKRANPTLATIQKQIDQLKRRVRELERDAGVNSYEPMQVGGFDALRLKQRN